MKLRIAILGIIILMTMNVFGQKPTGYDINIPKFNPKDIITDIDPTICPIKEGHSDHFVPRVKRSDQYLKKNDLTFVASYNTTFPAEARAAVENVVMPILQDAFTSPVPINIDFSWQQTPPGNLASANPTFLLPNFAAYTQVFDVLYPGPLAEKILRRSINPEGEADIEVRINMNIDWCFDCNTPAEVGMRFDFVSTILHEIYHGLGFLALSFVTDDGIAIQRDNTNATAIYNSYLEIRDGTRTILQPDGSSELLNHFQSNQLFFNLPTSGRAKLFAPNPYDQGSSISHLDDATFNNSPNSLMTAQSGTGEVERDAGLANDMMYDMGWIYTHLLHEQPDLSIENPVDLDYTVSVDVLSDNGFVEDSLEVHYSTDLFATDDQVVTMTKVDEDTYEAVIPSNGENRVITYFIEVVDNRGNRFSNPGRRFNGVQIVNQYAFGADNIDPIITHEPITSIKSTDPALDLFVNANDIFSGVDTLIIDWQFNGEAQQSVGMQLDTDDLFEDDRYIATLSLPTGLSASDMIQYKITATDRSSLANSISVPESGFFPVSIEEISSSTKLYVNDFDQPTSDFDGNGFVIEQPGGFASPAIHSEHPYVNGGQDRSLNFIYELQQPIRLASADKATIDFDEIVLVEPGELGVAFGITEFWDYVIVEGKKLGTNVWRPFLDGYDSNASIIWRTAYNNGIPNGGQDSDRSGDITLFQNRVINMLERGDFVEGDEILIRFRLFSDPFAVGWGWAIDNLVVQGQTTPVEDFILEENFNIIPNPTNGDEVTIALDLKKTSEEILVDIIDLYGKKISSRVINTRSQKVRETLTLGDVPAGIYIVNVIFNDRDMISTKLVKN